MRLPNQLRPSRAASSSELRHLCPWKGLSIFLQEKDQGSKCAQRGELFLDEISVPLEGFGVFRILNMRSEYMFFNST